VLEKNGEIVVTGAGAATMGHPVNAMIWLANTLGELGIALKAGDIVLSGAMGAMVPVVKGDSLRVTIGGIGGCSVKFV
jgi:2-oxopent-4-enoate/cis-2-oxohex-4-enoate hydratase